MNQEPTAEKDVPDSPDGIEAFDQNDHYALVFDSTDTQVWLGASGRRETCEWWATSENASLAPGEYVVIARRVTSPGGHVHDRDQTFGLCDCEIPGTHDGRADG